jgi:hypothetical protein
LGLESQYDHIDTFRPHWVLCDRTEEELISHATSEEAGMGQSASTALGKSDFASRMALMSGDSRADLGTATMMRAICAACLLMSWSPGLQRAARLLVCEAFDAAMSDESGDDDDAPEQGTPEPLVGAAETILDFRDRLVIETVRQWIGDLPMTSVAVSSVNVRWNTWLYSHSAPAVKGSLVSAAALTCVVSDTRSNRIVLANVESTYA